MLPVLLLLGCASGAYLVTTSFAGSGCAGATQYSSFYDAACTVGPFSVCVDSGSTSRKVDCVSSYSAITATSGFGSFVTNLNGTDCSSVNVRGYAVLLNRCVSFSPGLSVYWSCSSVGGGSLKQLSYGGSSECAGDPQTLTTKVATCLSNNTVASCNGPFTNAAMAAAPSLVLVVIALAMMLLLSK